MQLDLIEKYRRRIEAVFSHQLFFVVGSSKSGSTWLQQTLDTHPEVLCSGEGHFIDLFAHPMTQLGKLYNNNQKVLSEIVYDGEPYYKGLTVRDKNFLVAAFSALQLSQREITPEIRCIGDKTPENSVNIKAVAKAFPEARFVHIVRDGRDVAVSATAHRRRVARLYNGSIPKRTIEEQAKAWAVAVAAVVEFADMPEAAGRVHDVRYEDLKLDGVQTLVELFDFLDVDTDEAIAARCVDENAFEKVTSRPSGEEDEGSFRRKGIVGDWQNHFDDEDLEVFNQHAGKWLEHFEYV